MEIFKNTRGGQANRKSAYSWPHSDIANPQLRYNSPQIENPQICMISLQIRKFLQNIALLCLKTVLKVVFSNVQIYITALYVIFQRVNVCICGLAEVLSPQITEKIGSAKCHIFRKVGKSNKLFESANLRICDL
jgi:hypothetical protein